MNRLAMYACFRFFMELVMHLMNIRRSIGSTCLKTGRKQDFHRLDKPWRIIPDVFHAYGILTGCRYDDTG